MKTKRYLFVFLVCACISLTFVSCSDDSVNPVSGNGSGSNDPIVGTWHGWMDNYKNDPEEGHIWKWGEFGCLTVKSDGTAELEWWDGGNYESKATMTYSWEKTSDGYMLTYKSVRNTNPNDKSNFDDFACDIKIAMINSTTIDFGMWIGDSDEDHEQLTKGAFDLGLYRDLSKKEFHETTWHGTLGNYSCEVDLHEFSNWKLYQEGQQSPSYYIYLNYKKEGDVFKFTRGDNSGDNVSGFDNLEMQYVNSSQIKFRQQGSSTWSTFTPGKYTPTTPTPSTDWAALLKGTTWEMVDSYGSYTTFTFNSDGINGVYISGDDDGSLSDGGYFTYSVSSNTVTFTYEGKTRMMDVSKVSDSEIRFTDKSNWGNSGSYKKITSSLKVTGTWRYTDEDNYKYTFKFNSNGSGTYTLSGDGETDKENIYWAISGNKILIMDDTKEGDFVLIVTSATSSYLMMVFDEVGEEVKFKKV